MENKKLSEESAIKPPSGEAEGISESLRTHYAEKFRCYGATSRGVDWKNEQEASVRYRVMSELFKEEERHRGDRPTLLDVGCGYGGFFDFLKSNGVVVDYVGIDIVPEMISYAIEAHPEGRFKVANFLQDAGDEGSYDYAVCNGLGTLKLAGTDEEMQLHCSRLLTAMFQKVKFGCAMNFLTTQVDYKHDANFYYDPSFAIQEASKLTRKFKLDHSYPLYEYTLYLYR